MANNKYIEGVSICISAYKASKYIKETLDSIKQQTWFKSNDNWEVNIGIDGCKDTEEYVKCIINDYDSNHFHVYMMDSNKGTYITSNTLMSVISKYKWLIRFDADDIMYPTMVDTLMKAKNDTLDCVRFKLQNFADKDYTLNDTFKVNNSYIAWGQIMVNHYTFDAFGGYLGWQCSGDAEFLSRTKKFIKTKIVENVLFKRRITNDSLTNSNKTDEKSEIRKKYLSYIQNTSLRYQDRNSAINKTIELNSFKEVKGYEFIISLTSFPGRINFVKDVVMSLVNNKIPKNIFKIVVVLSTEEFPNKEKSLPNDLVNYCSNNNIEILWHNRNIRSHKKLIPTLRKYPSMPILVIDDDIIRNEEWLQMFIDDRRKYPNDILCMRCDDYITDNLECIHDRSNFEKNVPFSGLIYANRPSNGCGGVMYPSYTFTDERFFDEELLMKLSPSSDEMWQFCFNVINKQNIRRTSKFFNFTDIKGSQAKSLYKENKGKYTQILNNLLEYFPSFKTELKKRVNMKTQSQDYKAIIAMTSWAGRINGLYKVINNLRKKVGNEYKIVLTLSEEEFKGREEKLPKELINSITKNNVEIIWVKKNYKVFKKILFAMEKYPDYPIISADDDCMYKVNYADTLYNEWVKDKKTIISMGYKNYYNINNVKYSFPQGCATIYPCSSLLECKKFLNNEKILSTNNDDSLYGIYATLKNIKIKNISKPFKEYTDFIMTENSLTMNGVKNSNDFSSDKKTILKEISGISNIVVTKQVAKKKFIITLTSYGKRINNLPVVLPSLLNQSMVPDKIVINLAIDNFKNKEKDLPDRLVKYIEVYNDIIEVNWVEKDTKVWKKTIPTLLRYKNDLILGVDDDFIYPSNMVKTFYDLHVKNPDAPISGNKAFWFGLNCHCGSASLVQYKHFQGYIDNIPDDVYKTVTSSDLWFTYIANKNGYKYIQTVESFYTNMQSYNPVNAYSKLVNTNLPKSWANLNKIYDKNIYNFQTVEEIASRYALTIASSSNMIEDISDEINESNDDIQIVKEDKYVVYTCITGKYDILNAVTPNSNVDFICFTDDMSMESKGWTLKPIPASLIKLSSVMQARAIKINPHKYLPEYGISLWVDGNIVVNSNIGEFISKHNTEIIYAAPHPIRKCAYREIRVDELMNKEEKSNLLLLTDKMEKSGYPKMQGLNQTNILVRRHNDKKCIKVMEEWWKEVSTLSSRDSLTFNYALWKADIGKIGTFDKFTYNSEFFKWKITHSPKETQQKTKVPIQTKNVNKIKIFAR